MHRELRFAFRTLLKRPAFSLIALATLAIGIGANTAIFSLLDALYFRPLPIANLDELVAVTSTSPKTVYGMISFEEYREIAANTTAFQETVAEGRRGVLFRQDGAAEMMLISYVSENFFDAMGVPMYRGHGFRPEESGPEADTPVVVINHHLWQSQLGGREDVIGSAIQLNDTLFTVVGVTPPGYLGSSRDVRTDVFVTASQAHFVLEGFKDELADRYHRWFDVYGLLAPGTGLEQARAQLNTLARRWEDDDPKQYRDSGLQAEGLAERHQSNAATGVAFLGLVGMVLLIACANVANLTLARSETRRKELTLRAAIGASRGRLIRQLLTEGSVLAFFGGAAGLLLGSWLIQLLPLFFSQGSVHYTLGARLDDRVVLFTLATTVIAALLVGMVPAFRSSRMDLVSGLKAEATPRAGAEIGVSLRDVLVVLQIAVCVVVLVGAGLLVRSLYHGLGINPGFDTKKSIAIFDMVPGLEGYSKDETYRFFEECSRRVEGLPAVRQVSYSLRMPAQENESGWAIDFTIPGVEPPPGEDFYRIKYTMVGPDYFDVLGTRILSGRGITGRDTPDSPAVAVITETMARNIWPGENPIGKKLIMGRREPVEREVVGVAEDLQISGLYGEREMYVYVPMSQYRMHYGLLLVEVDGDPEQVFGAVRNAIASVDRSVPVLETTTLAAYMKGVLFSERRNASVGLTLGLLALSLAAIGLYGVVSLVTTRRTREMGIRMALGAERGDVVGLVLGRGFRLGVSGLVTGIAASVIASRYMASRLPGVEGFDPLTIAVVAVVLLAVTAVASLVPAWRATKVDPTVALRYE